MNLTATIRFPKGYIGHPFWPEQEKFINIVKESGFRRARTQESAAKKLRDYLETKGLTMEAYETLERRAARPFYTVADLNGIAPADHQPDEIIIPAHQLHGMIAQAADTASTSIRVAKRANIRTVLTAGDLYTGKIEPDGVWERFVVVNSSMGKLSNQRALRSNPYLGPFEADLTVRFDPDVLDPKKVEHFLRFAGRECGVGASRKLGWGRFEIERFQTT